MHPATGLHLATKLVYPLHAVKLETRTHKILSAITKVSPQRSGVQGVRNPEHKHFESIVIDGECREADGGVNE